MSSIGQPRRSWSRYFLLVFLGALTVLAAPALSRAQTLPAASLELVPEDALFYGAMLRNREQIEAVAKSKAWAKLMAQPFVQMLWKKAEEAWNEPQAAPFKQWYQQQENQQLVELLGAMFSDEVFVYGDRNTANFLTLLKEMQST